MELREPEGILIELDPMIHLAQLYITHHMVEYLNADLFNHDIMWEYLAIRGEPGPVRAVVGLSFDKGVDRVSIGTDRSVNYAAMIVSPFRGWRFRYCAALDSFIVDRFTVWNFKGDILSRKSVRVYM